MAKYSVSYIYQIVDKYTPVLKRISRATHKATKSLKKASMAAGAFGKSMRNVGAKATLFITAPIALMGKAVIGAASDFEESMNKVDVAFGKSAEHVKKFARSAGKDFGIDRGTALDMAAMFGDMSTSMGLSEEKAAELSTSLVGLAGDLASFKNIRVEQAETALAGIYTGETESLKRLGIVMTQTNLQQFAATQGIRKKVLAMTQDEKIMLRYNFVMSKSKNTIGDFLRTQTGFANQSRILSSTIKDLSITLGTILLPFATKLVGLTIKLVQSFQDLNPATQKTILIIAGVAAVAGPLLLIFGGILMALPLIATGFAALGGATALILGPIGIAVALGAALLALDPTGGGLWKSLVMIAKAVWLVIEPFAKLFATIANWAILQPLLFFLKGLAVALNVVAGVINTVITLIKGIGVIISAVVSGEYGVIGDYFSKQFSEIGKSLGFEGDVKKTIVNENVAAQGATNANTLNGQINMTANGGTIDNAEFSTSMPGNLGANVAHAQ